MLAAAGIAYGLSFWTGKPLLVWENVLVPSACTLFLLAYVWGWGALLARLRCFRPADEDLDPLLTLALGFCAAVPAILAFGFAGLLRPAVFLPFAALVALLGSWARPPWRERWTSFLSWSALEALPATALLLCLLAVSVLMFVPDFGWDALLYHLAVGKIYLREGRILALPWLFHANFPANGDLLFLHGLIAGGERTATAVDVVLALLAVAATYRLARNFLSRPASAFAALAFALSTDFLAVIGSCGVELCWTAFAVLSLACALRWRNGSRELDAWLHVSAVLAGFAAGTKITGLGSAAAVGLVLVLSTSSRGRLRTAVRFAWVFLLAASPSYVKSWIHTGTPIWPFALGVFRPSYWNPLAQELIANTAREQWAPLAGHTWSTLPGAVLALATDRYFLVVGLLLLFLAGSLIRWRLLPSTWPLVLFAGVHLLMWCFVTQQVRFLLPALPAVLVGLLAQTLPTAEIEPRAEAEPRADTGRPAFVRGISTFAFAGFWLVILAVWAPYWSGKIRLVSTRGVPILLGRTSHEQALDSLPFHAESRRTNELTPTDARILLYGETRGFWLDRDYLIGDPASQVFLDYRSLPDAESLRARLSDLGVTHVLVGDRPERDLRQRRAGAYDFRTESMMRDVLVQCLRTEIGALHALYDLRAPNPDDRPVLVASSTDTLGRAAGRLLPGTPGPREPEQGSGWMSSRVPDPTEPEEIRIFFPRPRAFHHLGLEAPAASAGTPTDFEFQWDRGGTWIGIPGADSRAPDAAGRRTFEFEPIETRRLRLVIRGTRGGKAEIARLEVE